MNFWTDIQNLFTGAVAQQGVADTVAASSSGTYTGDLNTDIQTQADISSQVSTSASNIGNDVTSLLSKFWNWLISFLGSLGIILFLLLLIVIFVYGFAESR